MPPKPDFLADLRCHIGEHTQQVQSLFLELDDEQLAQQPAPGEWTILQCFDHLNLTHDYYAPKIAGGIAQQRQANTVASPSADSYAPSFWGRIYMYFSLNPKYSFPTAPEITPAASQLDRDVLHTYLAKQETLLQTLSAVETLDLRRTTIPIEKFVRFNLGDCLKVVVYHDGLHVRQAERVLRNVSG